MTRKEIVAQVMNEVERVRSAMWRTYEDRQIMIACAIGRAYYDDPASKKKPWKSYGGPTRRG